MIGLDLIKQHCRVDFADDDAILTLYRDAAIKLFEDVAGAPLDDTDPGAVINVLRICATLYEHRESVDAANLAAMPGWMSDVIIGHWQPRC